MKSIKIGKIVSKSFNIFNFFQTTYLLKFFEVQSNLSIRTPIGTNYKRRCKRHVVIKI